jgi:RNA polymerase sigma factor (sigma-70 family)
MADQQPNEGASEDGVRWSAEESARILQAAAAFERNGDASVFFVACNSGLRRFAEEAARDNGLNGEDVFDETWPAFRHKLEKVGMHMCSTPAHFLGRLKRFAAFSILTAVRKLSRRRSRERAMSHDLEGRLDEVTLLNFKNEQDRDAAREVIAICITTELDGRETQVVTWRFLTEGSALTQIQIAERLRVTDRTVRTILQRAVEKLKRCVLDKRERWYG